VLQLFQLLQLFKLYVELLAIDSIHAVPYSCVGELDGMLPVVIMWSIMIIRLGNKIRVVAVIVT
jgi:hypothetical protein